jgi:hypothetical protein
LKRTLDAYTFRSAAPPGDVLVVRLRSPTWIARGLPPEQGVRVERMTVAPAR